MRIFSTLCTRSFSSKAFRARGFTLIELLISIAIIGIVTGLVLVKHTTFDSTVLLKNEAYEIAFLLREAQVKSVSVAQNSNNEFESSYGLSLESGSAVYHVFSSTERDSNPWYEAENVAILISTSVMDRTMIVSEIEVCDSNGCESVERLDVSFRRPEFKALFSRWADDDGTGVTSARVYVGSSASDDNGFVVEISSLGQISVYKAEVS